MSNENACQIVRWLLPLLIAVISFEPSAAGEEVRVSNRDELVRSLRQAKAGTTILLAAGEYAGGLSQARLIGTKEQPIVIAGEGQGRVTGYPRMARTGDELVFAWSESAAGSDDGESGQQVKGAVARLPRTTAP